MTEPAKTAVPTDEKAAYSGRQWLPVCVTRDRQYLVNGTPQKIAPADKIFLPWHNNSDPRMFVKNGEIIRPHGIVIFKLAGHDSLPELDHDRYWYAEVARSDFDPTGCVPIEFQDMEKYGAQINQAYLNGKVEPPAVASLSEIPSVQPAQPPADAPKDAEAVAPAVAGADQSAAGSNLNTDNTPSEVEGQQAQPSSIASDAPAGNAGPAPANDSAANAA